MNSPASRRATHLLWSAMVLAAFAGGLHAEVGESAVITLVFPYGARSTGMGETGVALADDESAVFWNPAGLGVRNARWLGGSATGFYEPLLPAFGIRELWHTATAACFQTPGGELGGFGANLNYINMGVNTWTDDLGRVLGRARSYEWTSAIAWGFELDHFGAEDHFAGVAVKVIRSALAPGYGDMGEGVANGWAVDLGYLHLMGPHWRIGTTIKNMGPSVFYISAEQSDPLPFTMDFGVGYKRTVVGRGIRILDFAAEFKMLKELVKNYWDRPPEPFWKAMFTDWFDQPIGEEIKGMQFNIGGELTLFNTGSLRHGLLWDMVGERYESTYGLGLQFANHYAFDLSYIFSPEQHLRGLARAFDSDAYGANGARHGQWRIDFTVFGFQNWSARDRTWWLE